MTLLAALDRTAIGSILRSKLVFLIMSKLLAFALIEGARAQGTSVFWGRGSGIHSAECVDIDDESNQVP
jgi:hypothetical protein